MRPFEGLFVRPGFVFTIAVATGLISAMLAIIAYLRFTIRDHGTAAFAAVGAILTAFLTWQYFRHAIALFRDRSG